MKITDYVDLFYPSAEAEEYAKKRQKKYENYPQDFMVNLETDNIAKLIAPMNFAVATSKMKEFTDDIETLDYRLDCLEDFMNVPELNGRFRQLINELAGNRIDFSDVDCVNSFMQIKTHMDSLEEFLGCIENINRFFAKYNHAIKSVAVKRLAQFFEKLPKSENIFEIAYSISQLKDTFSKTIRSVKIGVNFDSAMNPDSAGLLEIGYDKIYPKGNILEKLVFKSFAGREQFIGEEHFNSATRHTPIDIDTALFRELSKYTKEFALRIAAALKSYRSSVFSDLSELESQLDFYGGAAQFISSVRARGMKMCRPKFLPSEKRVTRLKNVFDLNFYRQLVTQNPQEILTEKIVANDIDMSDYARFYMVTGANNGGKTTFARAVGVCHLMAQMGLYVPAESAEISPADYIFTHFPKEEAVGLNSSRFTTEIKELKKICEYMTDRSLVILNESIQSTTPVECLNIAKIHLEIIAAVGVRGFYVTHLTELYNEIQRINNKNYPTKVGSLVSCTDSEGKRMYKMKAAKPPIESLAYTVYEKFGAKLEDVLAKSGDKNGQA